MSLSAPFIYCRLAPRISGLTRRKIDLFSLDTLMNTATVAGQEAHITIGKPNCKAARKRADGDLAAE